MAVMKEIYCHTCKDVKYEMCASNSYPNECHECRAARENKSEKEWKDACEKLTLEERVRRLEHFMYHHGKHYKGPVVLG